MKLSNNQIESERTELITQLQISFAGIKGQFKIIFASLCIIFAMCGWSALESMSARIAASESEKISAVMAAEFTITSKKHDEAQSAMNDRITFIEKNYIDILKNGNNGMNFSSNKVSEETEKSEKEKQRDKKMEKIKRICDF